MKASNEVRRWIAKQRKRWGRANGVVSAAGMDNPTMERKHANSKRRTRRLDANQNAVRVAREATEKE